MKKYGLMLLTILLALVAAHFGHPAEAGGLVLVGLGINTFQNLGETTKLVQLLNPQSFSGAVNSLFANLGNYNHATLLVSIGAQAAASTITVTASQDSSGTGETAIPFDYYLTSQATTQTSGGDLMGARASATSAGVATDGATAGVIYSIEVMQANLPAGSPFVRVKFSSPGAAVLGSVVGSFTTGRFVGQPANMPTVLA